MDAQLRTTLEAAIGEATGAPARIAGDRTVGGGSINDARLLELTDGRRFFVKTNRPALAEMFVREAEGLAALAAPGVIRVPRPIATGGGDGLRAFLVTEAIAAGRPGRDFFARFGARFAKLHVETRSTRFGFEHDNWIGSTPQPNPWCSDWVEFFREHRLGYQFRLAERQGRADPELARLGDRLLGRLDAWLAAPEEPACLLHGDLWSGNFLADESGDPVLIDPAAYYGRREADLAMTRLFGGFSPEFYRAYEEVWPLAPGADDRSAIYELYHLLNHLNLFGSSYRESCVAILRRFA